MEGADPLEAASDIDHWYRLGVRHVIPAWDDNRFSGTSMGDRGPLSAQGVALVERCDELGIVVDVSHLSDAAFDQVANVVRGPFIASHSDCRSLSPTPRNATDSQIRTLGERGGALGINLVADFLHPDYLVAWDAIVAPTRDLCTAEGQKLRRSPNADDARHPAAAVGVGRPPRPARDRSRRRGMRRVRFRPGRHQFHARGLSRRRGHTHDGRRLGCGRIDGAADRAGVLAQHGQGLRRRLALIECLSRGAFSGVTMVERLAEIMQEIEAGLRLARVALQAGGGAA